MTLFFLLIHMLEVLLRFIIAHNGVHSYCVSETRSGESVVPTAGTTHTHLLKLQCKLYCPYQLITYSVFYQLSSCLTPTGLYPLLPSSSSDVFCSLFLLCLPLYFLTFSTGVLCLDKEMVLLEFLLLLKNFLPLYLKKLCMGCEIPQLMKS